jgi:GntR family transcriptional regulator, transcriptional repressor for pyruvate dehydrogenase complex
VLEFLEVRRILEPAATAVAALRMPEEGRRELGEVLQAAEVNSPIEDFVTADLGSTARSRSPPAAPCSPP